MVNKILYCETCKSYTMQKKCSRCGGATRQAKPPKYSPEDRYGAYRRLAKTSRMGE